MTEQNYASKETRLELYAGEHPSGQPVFEEVLATRTDNGTCRLLKSPLFVRGLAAGDLIRMHPQARGRFEITERSGNLCVRVLSRAGLDAIERELTPEIEKLGGTLDLATERALVYSIHVAVGFKTLEEVLERLAHGNHSLWQYGNVYSDSGEPLDWWQAMLQP